MDIVNLLFLGKKMKRIIGWLRQKGTQEVMGLFLVMLGFVWLGSNVNWWRTSQAYATYDANIDVADCNHIAGWAAGTQGDSPVKICFDLRKDGKPVFGEGANSIKCIDANQSSQDVKDAGFGTGSNRYDFAFSGLSDGSYTILVHYLPKVDGFNREDGSESRTFTCPAAGSSIPTPPCIADCGDASIHCAGESWPNGCGGTCWGTKNCQVSISPVNTCTPNCGDTASRCRGTYWTDGCGGGCSGTKDCSVVNTCTPNCGNIADHCSTETWSNGCGGVCSGGTRNCSANPSNTTTTNTSTPVNTCTTATWKGGSVSSTSVKQGETLTIKCDYGITNADNISAYLGDTKCTWAGVSGGNSAGWSGTAAVFNCTPAAKGVFQPRCEITAGGNLNICAASSNYVDKVDVVETTQTTPTIDGPTDNITVDPRIVQATCGNVQGYAKAGTRIKFYLDGNSTYLGTTIANDSHIFSFDFPKYPLKHHIYAWEDCSTEGSTELCHKQIYNKTINADMFNCGDISQAENPKIKITGVAIRKAGYFGDSARSLSCGGMYNMYVVDYQVSEDVKADWDANKIYQMSLMADYDDTRYWSDGTFRQLKTNDHGASLGKTFGEFLVDYCSNQTSYDPATYKPKFYVAANYDIYRNTTDEVPGVVSALYDTKNVPQLDTSDFSLQTASAGSTTMVFYAWGEYHFKFYRSYLEDHSDKTEFSPPYSAVGNHWVFADSDYDKTKSIVYYQVAKEDDSKASNWLKVNVSQNNGYNPGGSGIGGEILDTGKIIAELSTVQGTNFTSDTQVNNIGEMTDLVNALVSAGVIQTDSSYTDAQKAEVIAQVAQALLAQGGGTVAEIVNRIASSLGIGGEIAGIGGTGIGGGFILRASAEGDDSSTPAASNATETPDTKDYSDKLSGIFKTFNIFEEGITLVDLFKKILNIAMTLAGLVALAFIIYGGYLYIMSGGSQEDNKKAMQAITQAAIGLVLVLAAWLIITTVINIFKK